MARSGTRTTLEKARYFLDRAVAAEADPRSSRIAYTADLEAAIIYGDATWDHLSAEFSRNPKYDAWKDKQYGALKKQPLFLFMSEGGKRGTPKSSIGLRHYFLHVGGNRLTLTETVQIVIAAYARVSCDAVIIRGQPWYRRSPKILWADAIAPIRAWARDIRQEIAARRPPVSQRGPAIRDEHTYYFDDPAWNSQPAREIVRQYLDLMEQVINRAENDLT